MRSHRSTRLARSVRSGLLATAVATVTLTSSGAARAEPSSETITLRGAEVLGSSTPTVFEGDLRDLPRVRQWQPGDPIKEIPRRHHHPPRIAPPPADPQLDPLLELQARAPQRVVDPPILNFAGQGFTGVNPPDTVGDIGLAHYIQSINSGGGAVFTVYDKTNGSVAAGPIAMESMGTGNCASGVGDPIVLFDQLASRWFLSEFSNSGNRLCIYVSQTSNPVTGGWFAYQFTAPSFPDYPKYGVWPDGYYASSNESSPAVYAFDRAQMLVGGVATAQRFTAPDIAGFGFQALTPADADGATPPPLGAPHPFMRHRDDEVHNPGSNNPVQDFLEVWDFHVDWVTPASSTFIGPTNIAVTELDSDLCGLTSFSCFPQQGGGSTLDPLREVIMNRLQYRNFGSHQTLVGNLTTDVDGTNHGGIRWFELRNTGGGWGVHQEGTFAPDVHSRWMGSAAMDGAGNIAVGYSVSSTTSFPSIRYAARLVTDPLGSMQGEASVIAGTAASSSNRWGDYSALNVDPVDDSTFWFTTMYSPSSSWATRIATFELCTPGGAPVATGAVAAASNRIDVSWTNGVPPSDSYNVYRAVGTCASPGPFVTIAGAVAGSPYQDLTVSGGTTYAYRVTGLLSGCESGPSGCVEATATGACTLPPTFAGLASAANEGTPSCGIGLAWAPATSTCAGPFDYDVHRSTTSGFVPGPANLIATGVGGTGYTDGSSLANGTTYHYVVRARDTSNGMMEGNTVQKSAAPSGPLAAGSLVETFEGGLSGGGFDNAGWTHATLGGALDWTWNATQSQTPSHSWASDEQSSEADRVLVSPTFAPLASSTLSFWHTFSFEGPVADCWDAGTLEASTNGGASWSVVPDANFTAGLYNGVANNTSGNPIGGKRAWCAGAVGAMTQVNVNLASFMPATSLKLRWHAGDDESVVAAEPNGWFVDSVTLASIAAPSACSAVTGIFSDGVESGGFGFWNGGVTPP